MAWGTPTSRATATDTVAPTTLPIASVTVASNSLILVAGAIAKDTPTITVSDSVGNSYTVIQSNNTNPNPDQCGFLAYTSTGCIALSNGTITVAWGGAAINSALAEVFEATGGNIGGFVDSAVTATGIDTSATTSPTLTSGTPSIAGDLLFAVDITPSTSSTWTEDTGNSWTTARAKTLNVSYDNMCLGASYQVNVGVGTTVWNPTTANNTHAKIIAGFKVLIPAANFSGPVTLADVTQVSAGSVETNFASSQTLDNVAMTSAVTLGMAVPLVPLLILNWPDSRWV